MYDCDKGYVLENGPVSVSSIFPNKFCLYIDHKCMYIDNFPILVWCNLHWWKMVSSRTSWMSSRSAPTLKMESQKEIGWLEICTWEIPFKSLPEHQTKAFRPSHGRWLRQNCFAGQAKCSNLPWPTVLQLRKRSYSKIENQAKSLQAWQSRLHRNWSRLLKILRKNQSAVSQLCEKSFPKSKNQK